MDILPSMVEKYNNTYHRSIKLKPTDARKQANYKHINNALYARKVNKLRIVRRKGSFEKGFTITIGQRRYLPLQLKKQQNHQHVL